MAIKIKRGRRPRNAAEMASYLRRRMALFNRYVAQGMPEAEAHARAFGPTPAPGNAPAPEWVGRRKTPPPRVRPLEVRTNAELRAERKRTRARQRLAEHLERAHARLAAAETVQDRVAAACDISGSVPRTKQQIETMARAYPEFAGDKYETLRSACRIERKRRGVE